MVVVDLFSSIHSLHLVLFEIVSLNCKMNTKVVKVFLLAMMVMVALLSINTTRGAQPGNQGGGMVAVSTENEKQERNDDTNAEILTDTREHFHESGLSAAMVDALRNLDDNHQSQSNDGTTTQTIDFSVE